MRCWGLEPRSSGSSGSLFHLSRGVEEPPWKNLRSLSCLMRWIMCRLSQALGCLVPRVCIWLHLSWLISQKPQPILTSDELTTIRKNLETQNVEVTNDFVSFPFLSVLLWLLVIDWHGGWVDLMTDLWDVECLVHKSVLEECLTKSFWMQKGVLLLPARLQWHRGEHWNVTSYNNGP